MTTNSLIYIILAVAVIIAIMRGKIDLISVCGACYILYTMYCIYGYGIAGFYRPKLSPKLYHYVYAQLLIILIYVVIKNYRDKKAKRKTRLYVQQADEAENKRAMDLSFYAYTAVIAAFAFINIARVGLSRFASGKANVWSSTNIFYIISLWGAFVSFAYGIHNKKRIIWIVSLVIELSIFFAGSRAFTASLIVIFLAEYGSTLWKNRTKNIYLYILAIAAVLFMIVYRTVDKQIMAGNISGALESLKNPEVWATALEFNEPRVIIANYDYAFTSGIRLPASDVVYRIIDFVPGATKLIPIKLSYPEFFSDWLRVQENASGGVAGTIWGESYAMLGPIGLLGATWLWLFLMDMCNRHLKYPGGHSYFLVGLGAYLSWYISRLDYNRVGQICKVLLLCYLIWGFFYMMLGGSIEFFGVKLKIDVNDLTNTLRRKTIK